MSDVKGLNNLGPIAGMQDSLRPNLAQNKANAGLFKEALNKISEKAQANPLGNAASLRFSNHAIDRMQARGIQFSPEEMAKIGQAVDKAQSKGAKNCLLISDQAAMIVSIKDKTVVTVMDKANLKENVFTNIDSTVMI